MSDLKKIGIADDTFRLTTVEQLVAERVLYRPMDGNHGEQHPKAADYVSEGIPFIMANDLSQGRINYNSCSYITKKQADGLRKGFSKPGDVLVTHKATIGRTALVGDEANPYIMLTPQVTYYRIKNHEALDKRYLRHYFDSSLFQQTLSIWAGAGATRAYLGITGQGKLPIVVPPRNKQRKIAAILTAYDDLIEVNKRRIALLEKMAEEIYREWFVRLRFPGYQHTLFVKGVPEGWEVVELRDICEEVSRSTRPGNHLSDRFYLPLDSLATKQMLPIDHYDYTAAQSSLALFDKGDILFGAMRPYQHKVVIAPFNGVTRTTMFVIRPKEDYLLAYSYLNLFQCSSIEYATLICNGADRPYVVWNRGMERMQVFLPSKEILIKFEEIAGPILKSIREYYFIQRKLAETRDLLLPRLISGKLSVEELDIQFPPSMQDQPLTPVNTDEGCHA